jgi:MFS family permease
LGKHIRELIQPLRFREFRLFWIATAISLTGDQLTFIALPWLVLKLTGDPLVMGTVMAIAAIPRAVFMLVGGVVTDAYSPRVVMIVSNLVRMILVALLASLTASEEITVWIIYTIGFVFGLADAFMFPAASAFPPRLLPSERLASGNSLIQGTAQLTLVVGPLIAGTLIATLGSSSGAIADSNGLAMVFAIDALSFLVPLTILLLIRDRFPPVQTHTQPMWDSLITGLRYTWEQIPLRTLAILFAVLGLVFRGPFMIGIPVFADAYLPEGAAAFGIIMSALGIGAIIGTIIAGTFRHAAPHWLGTILLLDFLLFGSIMIAMVFLQDTWLIAGVVLIAAIVDGYVIILLVTWTQQNVPGDKLGRVMSVIMLAGQGLFPLSDAGAGMLAAWDVKTMLLLAGAVMIAVCLFGLMSRTVRRLGHP